MSVRCGVEKGQLAESKADDVAELVPTRGIEENVGAAANIASVLHRNRRDSDYSTARGG
jgi:hypothetical protein